MPDGKVMLPSELEIGGVESPVRPPIGLLEANDYPFS
jgi:hypothetical protein